MIVHSPVLEWDTDLENSSVVDYAQALASRQTDTDRSAIFLPRPFDPYAAAIPARKVDGEFARVPCQALKFGATWAIGRSVVANKQWFEPEF